MDGVKRGTLLGIQDEDEVEGVGWKRWMLLMNAERIRGDQPKLVKRGEVLRRGHISRIRRVPNNLPIIKRGE